MRDLPDLHEADPIPEPARAEVALLLSSGDLFRYTHPAESPVTRLEAEIAAALGVRYALAVSSCSAALFLSLTALDLPAGARVLVPAFTFAAVPSAVIHAGCTPVLVECGDDLRLDMDDLAARLPGAAAVLVSHMRGHTSDMDALRALAEAAEVPVIEDAAHSLGATWHGRPVGTLGRAGCFSFQSYKMLNAGEGGLLVTDDAELLARAALMSGAYETAWRAHLPAGPESGADPVLEAAFARWQGALPLYNTRMPNLSAALIRAQLPELEERARRGRANHDRVAARIAHSRLVEVPAPLAPEARAPDSLQFRLRRLTDAQTDAFTEAAARRGLPVRVFGRGVANARAFWSWRFLEEIPELPKTRAMLMRTCDLRLPARLESEECDAVAEALLAALAEVADAAAAVA